MESKSGSNVSNGRILVAVFLALIGVIFGVSAALGEPSASRIAFTVIAALMIAGAGAALGAALVVRQRRK